MTVRNSLALIAAICVLAQANSFAFESEGTTHWGANARARAQVRPWHGEYSYTQWGAPVSLVVPPTAEKITDYTWGVGATEIRRIDHQFQRPYPGNGYGGVGFQATPNQPSHTRQFGVYPVRGPW
jgi:hypothetical protein